MPPALAAVLASGLAGVGRVTFAASDPAVVAQAAATPDTLVRPLASGSFLARWRQRLSGLPATAVAVSTRQASLAERLFDDPGFPWWLGHQAAILSAPRAPAPAVAADDLLALLEDNWATHAADLAGCGVDAVVRAGVDGDVLGLLVLAPAMRDPLLAALRDAADRAGIGWAEEPEALPR